MVAMEGALTEGPASNLTVAELQAQLVAVSDELGGGALADGGEVGALLGQPEELVQLTPRRPVRLGLARGEVIPLCATL